MVSMESALPSTGARVLALAAIVLAGICGGLIGWKVTSLQVDDTNSMAAGIGGLVGAIMAAIGVGVLAVLVLRAMGEWHTLQSHTDTEDAK